ncbi:MAG: YigZ family protein [Candidatus Latescibacteria bacterium]|jgi:uncharacterized YigZ family protein|nr:YigZ family protein [Candidatus Latescibacterota bacterium]MBT5832024.1 YigZ family protein [Candidatus Latescibacterota bacterium]
MPTDNRYTIPGETCRVEDEIKRSRFITTLMYTPTEDEARAFIKQMRTEFADASHNCWAYLIGKPGNTGVVGMSDDGEPHGTAGRPMLTVLSHCDLGDITAVVTRYYGGTNLGKGGLVRAYSGGVQHALENVKHTEHIIYAHAIVVIDYPAVESFKRKLPDYEVAITAEEFGADVTFEIKIPEENAASFTLAINELTNGQAQIEIV